VDDALEFLGGFSSPAAGRASARLRLIQEVGLGYLRLGQPINTLSGGESQRLKLAGHLAESVALTGSRSRSVAAAAAAPEIPARPTLFLFDEPTTGLHFEDVRILLLAFQRLVDAGHTVLIIEHNLEVLKCADWIIDLGPDAGSEGGRVMVAGTPEAVAAREESHTGRALKTVLD
jgi:excinuclease ABC subunit A